jgi:ketosteroid isomerase-like protein
MSSPSGEPLPVGPAWDAVGRLDAEALIEVCDADVTFESRITALEQHVYRGHEGIRRFIANLADAFEWIEVERSDVVQDRDRAVITNRFRACGRGSGVEVEQQFFVAMKGEGGKLTSWRLLDSRSAALRAVGLEE